MTKQPHTLMVLTISSFLAGSALAQDSSHSQPSNPPSPGQSRQAAKQAETNVRENGGYDNPEAKAKAERESMRQPRAVVRADGVRLSALSAEQIKTLQRELKNAGYYTGEVDGVVGTQTRQALRQYFSAQADLAAQGMLMPNSAESFGLERADIQRVRGEDRTSESATVHGSESSSTGRVTGTTRSANSTAAGVHTGNSTKMRGTGGSHAE